MQLKIPYYIESWHFDENSHGYIALIRPGKLDIQIVHDLTSPIAITRY